MISYSPRTTSLSVARAQTQRDAAEERFFKALDLEVGRIFARSDLQPSRHYVLEGCSGLLPAASQDWRMPSGKEAVLDASSITSQASGRIGNLKVVHLCRHQIATSHSL